MSGPAWTEKEAREFLRLTFRLRAPAIAVKLRRSQAAIQGMRRKLKRLLALGAPMPEISRLLTVAEDKLLAGDLEEIRRRAGITVVPVQHYLRRGRDTGKPHLVDDHARRPVGRPE